jgi:hypothetical protein
MEGAGERLCKGGVVWRHRIRNLVHQGVGGIEHVIRHRSRCPVVIVNGLAAILFMIGNVLFGVAMIRTAALPRWSGVLVAVGAPAHLLGFGIAQLVSTAAWPIAILDSVSLGAGLAWPGYRLWHTPAASDALPSDRSTRVSAPDPRRIPQ